MSKGKKAAIIVQSGTIDKLFPVLSLASTAGAMDIETHMFFTFWGLPTLKKGGLDQAGFPAEAKHMEDFMKQRMKEAKMPSLYELLKMAKESGMVKVYACNTTMELMGVKEEDLIPEVDTICGAATFLKEAIDADITLFV
ncbi:MAG: DsrE/DsrF/DrsH-like family protein [Promethearchaeota archaeon]